MSYDADELWDLDEARAALTEALGLAEELQSEDYPPACQDFAESVAARLEGIQQTIERTERVTEAQQVAVMNMHEGLAKWQR